MEAKNPFKFIAAAVIAVIPPIYLAVVWNNIPGTVAMHFDLHGNPDRYGSKNELVFATFFLSLLSIGTYLLVTNVHKLDKKRTKGVKPAVFDTIALVTVVFMTVISLAIIINSTSSQKFMLGKILLPAIGLFFIFMGNVMYNIKPNAFVGIRVPWTLYNEDNWRKTHRFGSKLFFVGGLLITLTTLAYPIEIAAMFMTGITLIITIASVGYSYWYHRQMKKNL